jgi:hypothetical protein
MGCPVGVGGKVGGGKIKTGFEKIRTLPGELGAGDGKKGKYCMRVAFETINRYSGIWGGCGIEGAGKWFSGLSFAPPFTPPGPGGGKIPATIKSDLPG